MRLKLRALIAIVLTISLSSTSLVRADQRDIHDWNNIRAVPMGQLVTVWIEQVGFINGLLARLDDESIAIIQAPPQTSDKTYKRLASLLDAHPDAFSDPTTTDHLFSAQHVRVSSSGIFIDDQRVGGRDEILSTTVRAQVTRVDRIREGSHKGIVVGILIGVGVGLAAFANYMWTALSDKRCQPSCPSAGGAIGLGVAAGTVGSLIGSRTGRPPDPEPIYRRQ